MGIDGVDGDRGDVEGVDVESAEGVDGEGVDVEGLDVEETDVDAGVESTTVVPAANVVTPVHVWLLGQHPLEMHWSPASQ